MAVLSLAEAQALAQRAGQMALDPAVQALAKEKACAQMVLGLDRAVKDKEEMQRTALITKSREKLALQHQDREGLRMMAEEKRRRRELERDALDVSLRISEGNRQKEKALLRLEAEKERRDLQSSLNKDPDALAKEESRRRLQAAKAFQEENYAFYSTAIGLPGQAEVLNAKRRMEDEERRRGTMSDMFYASREEARRRRAQDTQRTLRLQQQEIVDRSAQAAAERRLDKEYADAEARKGLKALQEKRRKALDKEVENQRDLAAAIAAKDASDAFSSTRKTAALSTMRSAPAFSRQLDAPLFLDRPLGRPMGDPVSWATSLGTPKPVELPPMEDPAASATSGRGVGGPRSAAGPGPGSPLLKGAGRAAGAPGSAPPGGLAWSQDLSPEALRAAKRSARERQAAKRLQTAV